jgi:acyl transferase domain-containing protein
VTDDGKRRELLRDALVAVDRMRAQLDASERARREPIAIVGMACRFPGGADDPDAYWTLLRDGFDAVSEVPHDRWDADAYYDPDPDAPGKMVTRWGAFLDRIEWFDAAFFRISPREAASMDPQQRMFLETTWHALEDAGYAPGGLGGTRTGVFLGICTNDYGQFTQLFARFRDLGSVDAYTGTGNAFSVAAGRVSHALGLQGPSMAVDTACSSSLVSVDLAVQSLRAGRCDVALGGGVNALLSPASTIYFSKVRALSPDGRCKTFDASANGYVRGEGCGVVVLKRLSDAQRDGDRVLAVIRGSAVNHDGRSSGLTVPNGAAQEAVIRAALADAGLDPAAIDYVEAHGTGTPLGDPIEMRALGRVFARRDAPLVVGSAKTNLGHLEGAAGVAGLMKAVLALAHGEIPPHRNFDTPSPHIAWDELPVRIPTEIVAWPERDAPRRAGVSSFGFGGTNAHVVLEAAPHAAAVTSAPPRPYEIVTLSAKSDAALATLAGRYAALATPAGDAVVASARLDLGDLAFAANTTRTPLTHRAAVTVSSVADAASALEALARGETPASAQRGSADGAPEIVFLFTGQGAQFAGMGRELYDTEPVFRVALDRCAEMLREHDVPLLELLYGARGAELDQTIYTQPALFALEFALAQLWASAGVEPAAVLGHSVGEYVAACVAGVLDLDDALRLISTRGRLMQSLPQSGAMAAVRADVERVAPLLPPAVAVAAVNAPGETVISGEREAVGAVCRKLEAIGIAAVPLRVSHAFHSPLMEPILDEFERVAARCALRPPQLRMLSNLTGTWAGAEVTQAVYWRRHLRERVRFAQGVGTAASEGYKLFVELGPQPTLCAFGQRVVSDPAARWLPSLRRGRSDAQTFRHSAAGLWASGVEIDWKRFEGERAHARVALPAYPFERERFWVDESSPRDVLTSLGMGTVTSGAASPSDAAFVRRLREAPEAERPELAVAMLQDEVARVVGLSEAPDPKQKFFELGMDSLMAVELRRRLEIALGTPLPSTLAFDHPDIASLARFVVGLLSPQSDAAPAVAASPVPQPHDDAVAIVGIGCRFPGGANDPEAFWELLRDGRDAVGPIPLSRWDASAHYDPDPDAPGKSYVRDGAFLNTEVDRFDARFFGITPREAASMDPQQRLFAELCWEALEHACQAPDALDGSRTGVFVGINTSDYARRISNADSGMFDAYAFTGNTFSVAAGRISHILGLQGPSLAVDTACSSSLVAVHLAAQSLRTRECDLALAGGVNLMLSADANVVLSRMRALAPDGRCKTFDARADGYARGEGGGAVVLKRLSDAQRDGDRVLAVLRASATNHDGPSGGLTVPNGSAQQALIRSALAQANVAPERIGYLEAHGTGTALGDPIELEAIRRALCAGRDASAPLVVGSVKTNIGHLEAAAGVAALIKVVLALQHGEIPAHLHFERGNPNVDWTDLAVRIPTRALPWNADGARIAGVSSFGMSGTNAHAIVEEAPARDPVVNEVERPLHVVAISARTETALTAAAGRLLAALEREPDRALADVAFSMNAGRAHFEHRLAFTADSTRALRAQLAVIGSGRLPDGAAQGRAAGTRPRVAFALRAERTHGIARELYDTQPVVRRIVDDAIALLARDLFAAVLFDELDVPPRGDERLASFVQQYALAQLWRAWGIEPSLLLADGAGAYAAACVAGILSFEDALRLASGSDADTSTGAAPGAIAFRAPRIRTRFALAGTPADGDAAGWSAYLRRHGAEPGNFADALSALAEHECAFVLDVASADANARSLGAPQTVWLPAPDGVRGAWSALAANLARLYVRGCTVDWTGFDRPYVRRRVALPTYAFERKRHWIDAPATAARPAAPAAADPLYELAWTANERAAPVPDVSLAAASGERETRARTWLILGRGDALSESFAQAVRDAGDPCIVVTPPSAGDVRGLLADALGADLGDEPVLLDLWSASTGAHDGDAHDGDAALDETLRCEALLHALQSVLETRPERLPRIWVVTCGAQAIRSEELRSPASATIWGMGRVVALEHPELWGGLVDLDPDAPLADAARVVADVRAREDEQQLAYRGGRRYAARLARAPRDLVNGNVATVQADASYLVTGGFGSLGLKVAAWLARGGARHLILTGRRPPAGDALDAVRALERDGVQVCALAVDVADRDALAAGLRDAAREQPPLRGIVHAAGVLDDGVVLMQTPERFAAVMAPKVRGTWNLHVLTQAEPLDFFVTFSSVAAVLGSPGQSNYAAANAFMDALAHHRRARGLPALSIAWGPWGETGMAAALAQRSGRQWVPAGVTALAVEDGLAMLGKLLASHATSAMVLPVDWARFVAQFPRGLDLRVLANVAPARASAAAGDADAPLFRALAQLAPPARYQHLVEALQHQVARVMGLDASEAPEADSGFFELGLDSLMAIELKNALATELGIDLPATITFRYPNAAALARHLVDEMLVFPDVTPAAASADAETLALAPQPEFEAQDVPLESEDELLAMLAGEIDSIEATRHGAQVPS